jgi:hypothetical protein
MRLAIAILGALVAATAAHAQSRDGFRGPLTGYEAELMSDVWYEIREAENFEDINWHAHGLNRAPASPEAQQFLATHWDELRREERFADIDWDEYRDKRSSRAERHGRLETGFPANESDYNSPFTREESAAEPSVGAGPRNRPLRGHQLARDGALGCTGRPRSAPADGEVLGRAAQSRAFRGHQLASDDGIPRALRRARSRLLERCTSSARLG